MCVCVSVHCSVCAMRMDIYASDGRIFKANFICRLSSKIMAIHLLLLLLLLPSLLPLLPLLPGNNAFSCRRFCSVFNANENFVLYNDVILVCA